MGFTMITKLPTPDEIRAQFPLAPELAAKKKECDGRKYSIEYPLPAYGVAVFKY